MTTKPESNLFGLPESPWTPVPRSGSRTDFNGVSIFAKPFRFYPENTPGGGRILWTVFSCSGVAGLILVQPCWFSQMERAMKTCRCFLNNKDGSVLVVALVILALLTIIGIAASQMSESELGMAANWRFQKQAFYAAEAAGGYVARSPELYDNENMSPGSPKAFSSPEGLLGEKQSFEGTVEYLGASAVPRGSGFEIGQFKAHRYRMQCKGYGPSGAKATIEIGFYRLGY